MTHTHPGAPGPTIAGVDLVVRPGEFLVVAGDNGTGKSTLAAIIAGRAPTGGEVIRPGPLGYGQTGGTAVIGQRPETGVLGMRVADDVAWGARGVEPGTIDQLLSLVGLRGFADAETATLSGGQLQRLAIASALVRRPALLVSDESTAMLDSAGRHDIMALYRRLASEYGTAVVHITHDRDEIAMADRVFVLRSNSASPVRVPPPVPAVAIDRGAYRWGASVRVREVSFAHDAGTPWQKPVFAGLSLSAAAGETVLVTGRNGAGKSTLARLLAGIDKPTGGSIFIDNEPPRNTRDGVLFGHQFSRLGIVRGRVRSEICDSAGVDGPAADRAMSALGFDPWRAGDVRVDVLSGGQRRRVALAGLLAARPRVLVLDEPLAGLDEPSRAAIVVALRQLKDFGTTIIIVTHDLDPFTGLADRTIELNDSREAVPAVSAPSRASLTSVVGRVLPNSSPARALWAGTKIAVLLIIAVMFAIRPGWTGVGVGVVIALVWTIAGRVPYSALPRARWWFAAVALLGGVVTAFGGGEPYVTVAGVELGCGGAITWALMLTIAIISLYLSLLLCWTTPMVEIPPLLQSITRCVSRLGIPAEALASAIAVALRFCPFMIGNLRILAQTISQRRSSRGQSVWAGLDAWFRCLGVACSLAVSDAQDLAQAMVNRGGIGRVAGQGVRPGRWDAVVSVAVAASCGAVMIWG